MVTDASSLHLMQELRTAQGYGWTVGDGHSARLSDRVVKPLHLSIAEHLMRQIIHYDKEFRREVATSAVGSSAKHWRFGSNGARGPMRPHPHAGQARGVIRRRCSSAVRSTNGPEPQSRITLCDESGKVVARHDPVPEHDAPEIAP